MERSRRHHDVCVDEKAREPCRSTVTGVEGRRLAAAGLLYHLYAGERSGDLSRSVGAAIADDDNLVARGTAAQRCEEAADDRLLVVGGDNDRDRGISHAERLAKKMGSGDIPNLLTVAGSKTSRTERLVMSNPAEAMRSGKSAP